jgi:hypothetical protein
MQYTHLAWSRRGFPIGAIRAFRAMEKQGSRVGAVFHDPLPFPGSRLRDRLRALIQRSVVRWLARRGSPVFSTLEPEVAPVFDGLAVAPAFLPAGSNVPAKPDTALARDDEGFLISVFCVTERDRHQSLAIGEIVGRAASGMPSVRLQVFGRGAKEAEHLLRASLGDVPISVEGLLDPDVVSDRIASSHALLFVRGDASSRRGTIAAAICNGVPVVGQEGPETGPAVRKSGIGLFPEGDVGAAAEQLVRLGSQPDFAEAQRVRQRQACTSTFGWTAIAAAVRQDL